jgi:hypothetical protein
MSTRKAIVAVAAAAVAAGLSVGLSGMAHASDPTVPSTSWNEIYIPFDNAAGNRLCVDIPIDSSSAGVALQFSNCRGYSSGGVDQRWRFIGENRNNRGLVGVFMNPANHLCISNQGGGLTSGVRLVQEPCHDSSGFLIRPENDNGTNPLLELVLVDRGTNSVTSLCLAAGTMADDNSTPLVATTCQQFSAVPQILELA